MNRLLVFSPHVGDELLGCAALIQQAVRAGDAVKVVIVAADGCDRTAAQATEALATLGVATPAFWSESKGQLSQAGNILTRYQELVARWRPTRIALPSPGEVDADRRRLTRGLLSSLAGAWSGELLFYEVGTPLSNFNFVQPCDWPSKSRALESFAGDSSPIDRIHARALAALRGTAAGVDAAEAFLCHPWDGSPQNFFDNQPLVSVIVRSNDQGLLDIALDSLLHQSYDRIEVVVVWHGGEAVPVVPRTLENQVIRGPGGRSANLNVGIAAANGQYVAFLDQDDYWERDFLELLVGEMHSDRTLDIAYGDYRLTTCRREGNGTTVLSHQEPDAWEHRPGLLLAGNHIPLNSFVCCAGLARRLRFDTDLQAYEDWDFLARAELAGAGFRRVPHRLSQYRIYPCPGEEPDLAALHRRKGYTQWYEKVRDNICRQLTRTSINDLLNVVQELSSQAAALRQQANANAKMLNDANTVLSETRRQLETADRWASMLTPAHPTSSAVSRLASAALGAGPVVGIVLPVCDPDPGFLREALDSVYAQTYANWQLCIADDASTLPEVLAMLSEVECQSHDDARLRVVRRPERGGIVAASQSAAALSDAAWLCFLDHDDRLDSDALLEVAGEITRDPKVGALYTDSRTIDRNGVLLHVYSKPCWSPETLVHLNYINHLTVVRRDIFESVGGLRSEAEGCQDWDLWLRLSSAPGLRIAHIPRPLYDWRASEKSVAYHSSAKPYLLEAACRIASERLSQRGLARVRSTLASGGKGLQHQWDVALQPMTVVIPTHANPGDLEHLLHGLERVNYPELNIMVVANRVQDEATQALLQHHRELGTIKVRFDDREFNWAALNNAAVAATDTPWLLFLNDDVELVSADTLQQLARYLALDPGIGAVGACLHYGEEDGGGIQHDGIATDPAWIARNIRGSADGGGSGVPRNVSAVTGACLLTRRTAFEQCGGFDERLPVSFNDVDYCLAIRQRRWRVLQASDVKCVHHESRTRVRTDRASHLQQLERDIAFMQEKWGTFLHEQYGLAYEHSLAGTRILHLPPQ